MSRSAVVTTAAAEMAPDVGTVTWCLGSSERVPAGDRWLSPAERVSQQRFVVAKRRADWRAGRWYAKSLLAEVSGLPRECIGVVARSDENGFPLVEGFGRVAPGVSISHCEGMAMAVVAPAGIPVGCDLERIARRADRFAADWFTRAEQRRLQDSPPSVRDEMTTLTWCVKEAALKAVGEGLRVDTREVDTSFGLPSADGGPVEGQSGSWVPVSALIGGVAEMDGWSRRILGHRLVVVAPTGVIGSPPPRIWTESEFSPSGGVSYVNGERHKYCATRAQATRTSEVPTPNNPPGGHQP
jgi:4'-phosphopantetheinyl transferase